MKKEHRCEQCNALEVVTYICDNCGDGMPDSTFILIDSYKELTHFCSYECINKFTQDELNKNNKKETQSRYICGKGKKA
jgi:hypothetical protein